MKRWILWLVVVAIAVRLAAALLHPFIFPDSLDYDTLARTILAGKTYAVGGLIASRMPGYPLFLSTIYAQTGGAIKAALVVQAFLGGAIVWMTYLLRRAGETVGLLAAALAAVDPLSIGFSASLLSETPFTLLLLVALWICLQLIDERRFCNWLALGIVWGAAVYLRRGALWCLPLMALVVCFCRRERSARWRSLSGAVTAIAIVFACLAPWQVRNFRAFGSGYFRLTTLEGISLYEAVYPGADGGPRQDTIALPTSMQPLNEAARSDELERRAWQCVLHDPVRIAALAVKKIGRTWSPFFNAGEFQGRTLQILVGLWQIPLFALALLGVFVAKIPARLGWLLLMPVFYFTLMHALFLGSVRYRVPMMPLVCIFAAAGVTCIARRLWPGKSSMESALDASANRAFQDVMIYARGNPARWWKSRYCGIASRAPGAMFISPFRRLISISALAILLLIIVGLWYITNPRRMARLAQTLLSNVVGGRVTVARAHVSMNGTLLLSGVELRTDDVSPGGESRRLPLFSADQIEARFDWLSLLSGQLSATQLTAIRPTLLVVKDHATDQWNYERMRSTGAGHEGGPPSDNVPRAVGPLPVILLRDAVVMIGETANGQLKETSETVIDGQLTPDRAVAGRYRFHITQHGGKTARTVETGPLAGTTLRTAPLPTSITGMWDVGSNRFAAVTDEIELSDELREALPREVRDWWLQHHLRGALSDLRLTFDSDAGLVVALDLDGVSLSQEIEPQPSDGPGPAQRFDVPLQSVRGNLSFGITKPSLHAANLRGAVMNYRFEASGDSRGASPESPFDLSVRFPNAFLPRDYPPLFVATPAVQELLQRTGAWGHFDLGLSLKRLSWNGKIFFDGAVTCRDAHMRFSHFPYPLEHLHGVVRFDNDAITFHHLTASGQENKVVVNGTVATSSADPTVDLTVSSADATFDDRVGASLPEKFQPLWNDFSLQGHGAFLCHVTRSKPADGPAPPPAITLDVTIDDGSGYMKLLPYRFRHAKGHLFFDADKTTIDHLTLESGVDGSGRIELDGIVKTSGSDTLNLQPNLHVHADVPIDAALMALVPEQYRKAFAPSDLAGRVSFVGAMQRDEQPAPGAIPVTMAGVVAVKDAHVTLPGAGIALGQIMGAAKIAGKKISVTALSGQTAEGLHLSAVGDADIAGGTARFAISAKGTDVTIPASAPSALPGAISDMWAAYSPAGKIDVTAAATVSFPKMGNSSDAGPFAQLPFAVQDASLNVLLKKVSVSHAGWPAKIMDITGQIAATPQTLAIKDLQGASDDLHFDLNAGSDLPAGSWTISGTAAAGSTPAKWLAKLPAGMADFVAASKPSGKYKLTLLHLDRLADGAPWKFDGTLESQTLSSGGPLWLGANRLSVVVKGTFDPANTALDFIGVLAGTQVTVSGHLIDNLTAKLAASAADKTLDFTDIDGKVAGGSLQGKIVVHLDDKPRCEAQLSLNDAQLASLMLPANASDADRRKVGTGSVSATLNLQQSFGDANGKGAERTGRGELVVRDAKIYNLPLAMGLMQLVTLRLPVAQAFRAATMSYYLRDDKVTFERILLESPGINLAGLGTMSIKKMPPTLDLTFITESPSEFHLPLISDLINLTRSELLQVSVKGSVDDPKITPIPLNAFTSTLKALLPQKKKP